MTRLMAALAGLVVAFGVAWFAGAALIVFALNYPGIPLLAAVALITAREAVHPHPIVTKLRSLT